MPVELDQEAFEAIGCSALRNLPPELIDRLAQGALIRDVAPGETIHRVGDAPFAELVVRGLIRAYVSAPDGRTMTFRYFRPGALMGTGTVFNESSPPGRANLTALVESRVLKLQLTTLRELANRDIRVTRALLADTSSRVADYINELEASTFASTRERLARHLLDIASERQAGPQLLVRASQEELAGAVGTVREVVVRILRDLRQEGVVRTGRGWVELLDAARLDAATYRRNR